jgi:hypothetical protein
MPNIINCHQVIANKQPNRVIKCQIIGRPYCFCKLLITTLLFLAQNYPFIYKLRCMPAHFFLLKICTPVHMASHPSSTYAAQNQQVGQLRALVVHRAQWTDARGSKHLPPRNPSFIPPSTPSLSSRNPRRANCCRSSWR